MRLRIRGLIFSRRITMCKDKQLYRKPAAMTSLAVVLVLILAVSFGFCTPVHAAKAVRPKKISIRADKSTITVGQKTRVRVTNTVPSKADKSVTWKTSSAKKARISSKGVITALKAGKVTVTAVSKRNSKVSAKTVLTIKAAEKSRSEIETKDGITVDHKKKTVSFQAKVNGNYLNGAKTMHVAVSRTGTMARYAMLKAQCPYYAAPGAFYNGMLSIGAKPWNTERNDLKEGEKIGDDKSKIANADYSHVKVTLTWPGQSAPVPLENVLLDDSGNHPVLDMVFSGNQANQKVSASGCMICTNSCYYGAISNQANGYSTAGKYHIDAAHFPAADTLVTVTVSLK